MKKGAMFGLDARIALAIFGALSVISGAALYSAIQQSKVIALLTNLEEIGKAYQQYLLDTGQDLPAHTTTASYILDDAKELVSSNISGWQGPYLPYTVNGVTHELNNPMYNKIAIFKISTGGSLTGDYSGDFSGCTATVCDVYAVMNGIPKNIADALDAYVDGSSSYDSGNLLVSYESANSVAVFYKVMPAIGYP